MIVGLGIDLVELARIAQACHNPRFANRILTPLEKELATSTKFIAGRWAAKEAVAKAVGLGLTWQQIEILPDELGVPRVTIHSGLFDPGRLRILVSITHERSHAAAVATLERIVYQAPQV